jgi:DNA-directed RNA polymerase II subunit RPB2
MAAANQIVEGLTGDSARRLAMGLIHSFFSDQQNPMVMHHISSYNQFIEQDIPAIIRSYNPILLKKNPNELADLAKRGVFMYEAEIYIGGEDGSQIFVGTPTVVLDGGQDVRLLLPNEARLRNLTYAVEIKVNILVKLKFRLTTDQQRKIAEPTEHRIEIPDFVLCRLPLMLQSKFCPLYGKSPSVLMQLGECGYDQGGYFIVDGSEKVLVTRQDAAFNALWITKQTIAKDPNVEWYAQMSCLNPITREVKRVGFFWTREKIARAAGFGDKDTKYKEARLELSIPFVLQPVPLFVLFRALGYQTDKEILQLIFPDPESPETKELADMLIPSINAAAPILDTWSAIEFLRSLTKGFTKEHILDIVHNHLFPHVPDLPGARAAFLADCVRRILRTVRGLEQPLSRDDTRHQRLLTSGFLCQMLFQNLYKEYIKLVKFSIEERYAYNQSIYAGENFKELFAEGGHRKIFAAAYLTEGIMRGFKGKWKTSTNKEEAGLLQELSRLSYLDFMSHLRHAVLNFDTGMKLQGPRRLNPSQYGYFCTNEVPSGKAIGITKNLTMLTMVSTASDPGPVLGWLYNRKFVTPCEFITPKLASIWTPVYLNSGIIGYTPNPVKLARALRLLKRTGCLPPLSSSGFSIPERRCFLYLDGGRPMRPLIICEPNGTIPKRDQFAGTWTELITGKLAKGVKLDSNLFIDPLQERTNPSLNDYIEHLQNYQGVIEYIDPYEQNEILVANQPEHILPETTHMEVHPSSIMGLIATAIPFANHNQSPRNQLGSSQSKQGLSIYATNFKNRFDNTANILCYGQAPLVRTIYQDYVGGGILPYGENVILALGMYGGYNQEDGIIMNADALARGQFRSINYRSYETFEEDDLQAQTQTRFGHPKNTPGWTDLKPQLDYGKLDDNGIIKPGSYVDQYTVLVGRYTTGRDGRTVDASLTPQVWTRGRVESIVSMNSATGLKLIKIRITQDRVPELGDKFSNRHGQKGTLNVLYRGHDMPRTADGIVPDMIMNPTAIPSRMTIGQILEQHFGLAASQIAAIANGTTFMNEDTPHEAVGDVLEKLGFQRMGNQILYNGMTGEQMEADIFMGVVYGMRLKHMTEDKWNARGQGRKEQRTHQPTGGRGNEGGLKIGEMERDAIVAHGISSFMKESMMERSDATDFIVCNGCGTIPIYNTRQNLYLCSLCDGPIQFVGETATNLDPVPTISRSATTFSRVSMPYATKLLFQELETYANIGTRILTTYNTTKLKGLDKIEELAEGAANITQPLPLRPILETQMPELRVEPPAPTEQQIQEQLAKLKPEDFVAPQQPSNQIVGAEQQSNQEANQEAKVLQAPQQTAVLQDGSVAPQPLPQPQFIIPPGEQGAPSLEPIPPVQQTAIDDIPIIQVDTSDAAMALEGLRQPNDRNLPVVDGLQAANVLKRSRSPRTAQQQQQQQQGGYQHSATGTISVQKEGFDEQPLAPSAPVTVVKLG